LDPCLMKLNHLNLCVLDLDEARQFFAELFDFEFVDQKGDAVLVMRDREGFTLVISDPTKFGGDSASYPEGFHVGFLVDTSERVDAVHSRLVEAGIEVTKPPRKIRDSLRLLLHCAGPSHVRGVHQRELKPSQGWEKRAPRP
jgi:catechol 2,3-dioxygenase-like lactoylglutathione lyase family enzyme